MTETCGVITKIPRKDTPINGENVPPGTVGLPVPGCELKVTDIRAILQVAYFKVQPQSTTRNIG